MAKKVKQILLWLRIIRPQTLFASLCPVLVGLMVTHQFTGRVEPLTYIHKSPHVYT